MQNTVPFDPGYSDFSVRVPPEVGTILDEISKLKQLHQKKFEFQKFEMQIVPIIKRYAAIYLGCVLWGSYLFYRYKDDPREISGNIVKDLPDEQRENLDYSIEIDFVTGLIDKLNRAGNYYLRRPSTIGDSLTPYFQAYREFCELNDNFKTIERTDQIKLPSTVAHFKDYDSQTLEELKNRIEESIKANKIESLIELGFYHM